jgi:hypothetical protein
MAADERSEQTTIRRPLGPLARVMGSRCATALAGRAGADPAPPGQRPPYAGGPGAAYARLPAGHGPPEPLRGPYPAASMIRWAETTQASARAAAMCLPRWALTWLMNAPSWLMPPAVSPALNSATAA